MERDILEEMTGVFREVFDDETTHLSRSTTAADVAGWDSLSHIEMIVAMEKHFGIQFKSLDLQKLQNVGDLADLIKQKLSGG